MEDNPDAKVCTKCGERKPLDEFYAHKMGRYGKRAACKACMDVAARKWDKSNPEKRKAISRRYHAANRQKEREYSREWRESNRGKELSRRSKWSKDNRERERIRKRKARRTVEGRARMKVWNAVRNGTLRKPDRCEDCGKLTPAHLLHGHHEDYGKPLEVEWLCPPCHGLRHRKSA